MREFGESAFLGYVELLLPTCRQQLIIGRNVVNEHNIKAVDAESLQAVLNRTPHAGCRVIEDYVVRRGREREELAVFGGLGCLQQLANLGGDYLFTSVFVVQKAANPSLGKPQAIPGRNVVIANACAPRGFQNGDGIFIRYHCKFISQWNTPQPESKRGVVMDATARTRVIFRMHTAHAPATAWIDL